MTLLHDLVIINEKKAKKKLRKAAKNVYHRDYLATKNKPYRKYHPERTNESYTDGDILDENAWDYMKGVGKYIGKKVYDKMSDVGRDSLESARKLHTVGMQTSQTADADRSANSLKNKVTNLIKELAKAHQTYLKLKQDLENSNYQSGQQNEGLMNFARGSIGAIGGAARKVGSAIGQAGNEIYHSGEASSLTGDMTEIKKKLQELTQKLCWLAIHKVRDISKVRKQIENVVQHSAIKSKMLADFDRFTRQ